MPYLKRALEPTLRQAATQFPAVLVTGPRQAGKTTLLRHVFGASHGYANLDLPEEQQLAREDPRLFFERHPPPVVIDEVQHAPELLPYLKDRIDRHRDRRGDFVLSGSQAFALMAGVSESLAGRVAVLELLTMSWSEQQGRGGAAVIPPTPAPRGAPPEPEAASDAAPDAAPDTLSAEALAARIVRGGFPELVAWPDIDAELWHEGYLRTYLERDVRALRQVGDLGDFRRLLLALAARAGQLLNMSGLARELGVAVNTTKAWLSVLEASHQVTLLRPYHANLSKRLVKTPKLYFNDTGTLCHLLGLRDPRMALAGALGGPVFENAVFAELLRAFTTRGRAPRLHFFRTSTGHEVDFLVEHDGALHPVEVKRAATPRRAMADGIERLRDLLGPDLLAPGWVVLLGGPERFPLTSTTTAITFEAFAG